jgi:WD40 repeat protein
MRRCAVQILTGHLSIMPVRSLAFSPDGTKLASSARDYKTFLWDLATGEHEVIESSDSYTVAFSPDGKTIATGRQSDATLWDSTTRQSRRLEIRYNYQTDTYGHGWDLAYSPDGTRLVAVSGVVRLYDAATLKEIPLPAGPELDTTGAHPSWRTVPPDRFASNCLAFTRDGATLATGYDGWRKAVRLWDARTWQIRQELTGATAKIAAVSFSPDGKFLAAAAGATLWVWEVASGTVIVRHAISKQHCKDVAFSPDGRLLAFARNDASICFLSTAGWNEVAAYDFKVGPMICLDFAPDGMRAAGGSGKGKVVVFDVDL